ncbi:MAG: hypothetical protein EOO77_20350 [Oxalobacteraceae bacterium]|nr:MAG: hypothetical protein EOO77_20350 [Oxalobacteraceae bacterium]
MNPFLLGPRDRLTDWKLLRESLKGLSEREQLAKVAHHWSKAPLARFAYDPENAKSWPTIWEMISENDWCRNSVAIGMEQTLRLSGWNPNRIKLAYVKDHDLSDMMLVVQVDDRLWLNYEHDVVRAIPDTRRETLVCWQYKNKTYQSVPCR